MIGSCFALDCGMQDQTDLIPRQVEGGDAVGAERRPWGQVWLRRRRRHRTQNFERLPIVRMTIGHLDRGAPDDSLERRRLGEVAFPSADKALTNAIAALTRHTNQSAPIKQPIKIA